MRSHPAQVLLQPLAVVMLVLVAFVLGNEAFRHLEAAAATDVLHLLNVIPAHRLQILPGTSSIAVFPLSATPFVAILLPSCSSLSSLLALTFLAWFVPRGRTGRRLVALACALLCVFAGNVARIVASIGVGLVYGPPSLVLFHDFVGSMFAFAYTLGGYLLMLFLLLPRTPSSTIRTSGSVTAPESQGADRVSA